MSQGSSQEKTEQPTPKKLQDAKKEGNVPRSKELSSTGVLILGAIFLLSMGHSIVTDVAHSMHSLLDLSREDYQSPQKMWETIRAAIQSAFIAVVPFILMCGIISYIAQTIVGGQLFKPSKWAPKLNNINPINGLKNILSVKSLMELFKSLLKFGLIVGICLAIMPGSLERFIDSYSMGSVVLSLKLIGKTVLEAFLAYSLVLIVVTGIDVPFQVHSHIKQLRMTKQEIKEEFKNSEGDPLIKGRMRQIMRETSQRRSLSAVPEADVIITNPTHYAVAIKYKDGVHTAPIIIAMGKDNMAMSIRAKAAESKIPVLEIPPLARALYFHGQQDHFIPYELFTPVAKVLIYLKNLPNKLDFFIDSAFVANLDIPRELSEQEQ